jgi:hypothetical protein
LGHTPSSGNVREAQRLRLARVTFPQRLHSGTPLHGDKNKKTIISGLLFQALEVIFIIPQFIQFVYFQTLNKIHLNP